MAEITWAEALKEAEDSAARDPNLWAQCFAESDGDEGKARALYVKRRMNAAAPAPAPAPAIAQMAKSEPGHVTPSATAGKSSLKSLCLIQLHGLLPVPARGWSLISKQGGALAHDKL